MTAGLETIRENIARYDSCIVLEMIWRSKFLVNEKFYSRRRNHPEFESNSALFHFIHETYLPILSEVCKEGNDRSQWPFLFEADEPLIFNIMQRTGLGFDVAEYKYQRGLPVFVKEVEDKKLKDLRRLAKRLGGSPKKIANAMQIIMDETKRIQEHTMGYMQQVRPVSDNSAIRTYRAGTEQLQCILENIAGGEIEKLEKQTGLKHSVKKSKEGNIYLVEIHKA